MKPKNRTLTLTKTQGATRQTNAAIDAFARGDFDIAITLAAAAEGMLKREGQHLFRFLLNSPRVKDIEKKIWISSLNREVYWLKHPSGLKTLQVERGHAAIVIARAASKLEKWSPRIEEFKKWLLKNVNSF